MKVTPQITKRVREFVREAYEGDDPQPIEGWWRKCPFSGSYRMVIIEDGVAYKFGKGKLGVLCNISEWDTYKRVSPSTKAKLAKPLAISECGRVIAFEAVQSTVRKTFNADEVWGVVEEFEKEMAALEDRSDPKLAGLFWDIHASNVGVRANGELCQIDYGYA